MADKNTKFKDLKKGDHLYWVSYDYRKFYPIFCEYELIDDMKYVGPSKGNYECHIIPINYNPETDYLFGPTYDGTPQKYWTGWCYNTTGKDHQMTTCLEYAEEYYQKYYALQVNQKLDGEIKKLQNKINQLITLKKYHQEQYNNFNFYKKL